VAEVMVRRRVSGALPAATPGRVSATMHTEPGTGAPGSAGTPRDVALADTEAGAAPAGEPTATGAAAWDTAALPPARHPFARTAALALGGALVLVGAVAIVQRRTNSPPPPATAVDAPAPAPSARVDVAPPAP